ncbi:hypothetical protein Drorol1_Dr00007505 [Drosera rotundifolia]
MCPSLSFAPQPRGRRLTCGGESEMNRGRKTNGDDRKRGKAMDLVLVSILRVEGSTGKHVPVSNSGAMWWIWANGEGRRRATLGGGCDYFGWSIGVTKVFDGGWCEWHRGVVAIGRWFGVANG